MYFAHTVQYKVRWCGRFVPAKKSTLLLCISQEQSRPEEYLECTCGVRRKCTRGAVSPDSRSAPPTPPGWINCKCITACTKLEAHVPKHRSGALRSTRSWKPRGGDKRAFGGRRCRPRKKQEGLRWPLP